MSDLEQKRTELENAVSEISPEEMEKIVGGMSEKTKKALILAGKIAGVFVVGAATGATIGGLIGYNKGNSKGYIEGRNDVVEEADLLYDLDKEKWVRKSED